MDAIKYRGNNLYLENALVEKIAKKNTTPFYLYSLKKLENNFNFFTKHFLKPTPSYALL